MAQDMDYENGVRIESVESMERIACPEEPAEPEKKEERAKPKQTRKTAVRNVPMCIACVLFCLTLISIRLTSGLYAKYVSTGSGSDSARVISFGNLTLTETGDFTGGTATLIPGVNLTKQVQIGFTGSESATYVFVELDLASGASASWFRDNRAFSLCDSSDATRCFLSWSVESDWTYLPGTGAAGPYVFYRQLGTNTPLTNADVIADSGEITVSDAITKADLANLTGLSIDIRATVVQSGGFANAAAAWASVSAH